MLIPKGFLPSEDQGRFSINDGGVQGIGYDDDGAHKAQVADIVRAGSRTSMSHVTSNVGG